MKASHPLRLLRRRMAVMMSRRHGRPGLHAESQLAHHYLDGLRGLEIGGAAHNAFGLDTLNVDYTSDMGTRFKRYEIEMCGKAMPVDVVYDGKRLPFADGAFDFVVSSHVLEHFYDPIAAIEEWLRVVRKGGYVFMIVPHKERTFDKDRPRTPLAELVARHERPQPPAHDDHEHYSVWITEDLAELCRAYGWHIEALQDVDDKVGNGFTVVLRKTEQGAEKAAASMTES